MQYNNHMSTWANKQFCLYAMWEWVTGSSKKEKIYHQKAPKGKKEKEKNKNKKKRKSYKFTMSSQPKHYILVGSIIYKKPK